MDLSTIIHLLGDFLGEVISQQESQAIFGLEERIRQLAKERRSGDASSEEQLSREVAGFTLKEARAVAAAFALYFDLVNLAEEHFRVNVLQDLEREKHPEPVHDSIESAIVELKKSGVTPEQIQSLLNTLQIELVLTAHPTEAKRRTILSKLQRISDLLSALSDPRILPREEKAFLEALREEITILWLTDRNRTERPTVTDEVRTGLYFLDSVFWEVLPEIYRQLDSALEQHYPGVSIAHPWLRLASWIGGDRDGNPNVTTEITAETLRLHRGLAVEKHRQAFQDLARRLSLSARGIPPPAELLAWFEQRRPLPSHVAYLEDRYANEPYRLVLSLLANDLAEASRDDMTARLLSMAPHTARARLSTLMGPLRLIRASIPATVANGQPLTVMRQLEVFGLHSACLDIREDSARLNAAAGEAMRALHIYPNFEAADGKERVRILTQLLESPQPDLSPTPGITPETAETFALFQLITRIREIYGPELLGPFIISMTHDAADILVVLLLARWSGCGECMPIVPLFETIDDLAAAPGILSGLFSLEIYKKHLVSCENRQIIMIGYSDSNKDAGYLAANWALYQAQENIAKLCRKHHIELTLFHGRGGTVARGGGPANRAIRSQPAGTVEGRFRLTEQGEIIASRYSNRKLAFRHLEQIVHAVLLASSPASSARVPSVPTAWRKALTTMANAAYQTYRSLAFDSPGFLDYWRAVTPLDEITQLSIGSR
ncbi:MAG TPA: phosphoenolpyruvate carboxylase, partial [Anaerolineales bacterium]|nr:phosphoenolpyruvate carboxylase [Anaerolineales bacterium]